MSPGCPIRRFAERLPEKTALCFGAERWTYRALDGAVEGACAALAREGVRPGDRVAYLSPNRPELVFLLFAAARMGVTVVPVNARLAAREILECLERVRARRVFVESSSNLALPGAVGLELLRAATRAPAPLTLKPLAPSDTWVILFTSGTTGRPKAAELTFGNLLASAELSAANLGGRPEQTWLATLPLFHVGGIAMTVRAMVYGATLVLESRFDAASALEALRRHEVTHASFVPQTLQAALELHPGRWPGSLRAVLVGGAPATASLVRRARDAGVPVLLTYGLTEACSQVATERPDEADGQSAGAPLPGLEVRIVDGEGRALGAGAEGEIEVRGPSVMRGYLEDADATRDAFRDGWLRTRDLGALDETGRLHVFARRQDLILSGGENVYPAQVEAALAEHPEVLEAAVVGVPDPRWGEVPVAFLRLQAGRALQADALRAFCLERLARFKVPKHFLPSAELPRTGAGKVDRSRLRQLAREAVAEAGPASSPSNSAAVQVVLNQVNTMDTGIEAGDFLAKVEDALARALAWEDASAARSDTLMTASRHLCIGGGGKRIRPLMVKLFGEACGAPEDPLLSVAVAAELVHSASLLHDDVVDSGMFRRSRPTVNALWGNIVAVMAGDLVLTVSLQQLALLDRQITFDAVETVAEMTRATIIEVEARADLELPLERFRAIAEGKTGALFGFCGRAAALLAGKPEVALRFNQFGRHLGVAFQIADDLKDLNGGDPGKPQFADFRSRTASLPILLAARADDGLRRRIKDLWAFGSMPDEKVKELGEAVLASEAPGKALAQMQQEISAALDALGPFALRPGGIELKGWAQRLSEAF